MKNGIDIPKNTPYFLLRYVIVLTTIIKSLSGEIITHVVVARMCYICEECHCRPLQTTALLKGTGLKSFYRVIIISGHSCHRFRPTKTNRQLVYPIHVVFARTHIIRVKCSLFFRQGFLGKNFKCMKPAFLLSCVIQR